MNRSGYAGRGANFAPDDRSMMKSLDRSADSSMYNRKAFAWNRGGAPGAQEQPKPQPAPAPAPAPGDSLNRIYEVVATTGTVRAEPHMQAKMKAKKSRGGRIICSQITMNGWVKLANEPGWLICHMQGIDGIAEVALPVDGIDHGMGGAPELAVPEYQPQAMCCLEVTFKSGVPVRESPSKDAKTIVTRKQGEFVFVHVQNFDGWVKLWGEDGWMLANHQEWGALLQPRVARGVDFWALGDAWAAARRARKGALGAKEVAELKELERRMLAATSSLYDQHASEGKMQELVDTGLLAKEDLTHSDHWAFQRLFAGVLRQAVQEEANLKSLLPDFQLSERVPPLFGAEDDLQEEQQWEGGEEGWEEGGVAGGPGFDYDPDDPAFEGTTPVEFNGRTYIMAPNNVIFDPPNQTPIGIWNNETNKIDPAAGMVPGCPYAALSYFGQTYLLMPDGKLLEPESQKVVGCYNRDTNEMELENDPQKAAVESQERERRQEERQQKRDEPPIRDPVFDDDEPVDPQEYMERGHQMVKGGHLKSAVPLYDLALQGVSRLKTVDMAFECEILRARAACHLQLGSFRELKEDADRILGCFPSDAEAQEWKRRASDGIRRAKFGLEEPVAEVAEASYASRRAGVTGSGAAQTGACPQCNGLASRCATCGAGMQRCANCAAVVTKANCCSRCHSTYYCGRECQRAHWKVHKLECKSSEE